MTDEPKGAEIAPRLTTEQIAEMMLASGAHEIPAKQEPQA